MLKKFRAVSGVPLMSTLSEEPSSPTKVCRPYFQEPAETDQAAHSFSFGLDAALIKIFISDPDGHSERSLR